MEKGTGFPTYKAFWPHYVSEHQVKLNRNLHFLGTLLALSSIGAALMNLEPWFLLPAPFFGYGFAWFGHFFVEKNRPATLRHPVWSLMGDFHMFYLMCLGRMDREVRRMGVLNAEA